MIWVLRKRIFSILILLAAASAVSVSASERASLDALWDRANTLYINGDSNGAAVLYDSILARGYAGSKLYYNLGNAHFKANRIGKAVVNYNKALKLAPYDSDIEYNLAVANSYVKDRIETVPEFFISGWLRQLRTRLTSNVWAVISLGLLAAIAACVLLYMLARGKGRRKAGFFTAIFLVLLLAVSVSFSVKQRNEFLNASQAVVITPAVSVKSSPERSSKELFIIHEGTKVNILTTYDAWTEITIADGNKGWILTEAIELI